MESNNVVGTTYLPATGQQKSRGGTGRGRGGRHGQQSNQSRAEAFREVKGNETMREYAKRLDERLFAGFSDLADYIQKIHVSVQKVAVQMPITTRGIGFMTQNLYNRLNIQIPNFDQRLTIHQIFRTALAQFAVQMDEAKSKQTAIQYPDNQIWQVLPLDYDLTRLVKANPSQFAPLAGIINAAGNVKVGEVNYYASRPINVGALNPFVIGIQNLREVVVALADVNTPLPDRLEFFQNSPLPGAVWDVGDMGPILQNGDAIMPADYNRQQMLADFTALKAAISHVGRKLPKYVNGGLCAFDGDGSRAMLVSTDTHATSMQIPSAQPNHLFPLPVNCIEEFYCGELISDAAMYMGAICLLGEVRTLEPAGFLPRWASPRAPRGQHCAMNEPWDIVVSALLG